MKVALFGAGRIGTIHAASVDSDPRSSLAAVTDVSKKASEALASEYGADVMTPEEIFKDSSIDAILIASPTNTHAKFIEAGVAAGMAVFCEKPVDLSLERALRLGDAVKGHDRPIMMGFNRRFDPNFVALKAALDAGEVGKGELLAITSCDPAPPPVEYIKVSGGLFRDMMIHDFDMAAFLFGMPARVMAHGACLVDEAIAAAGDIDTAVVTLEYEDGRLATIRNSRRASYGYDQRVEILGSLGMIAANNETENTVVKTTGSGSVGAKPVYFFLERYMRAYAAEWFEFVNACVGGAQVSATIQDGVNALAIAEAANMAFARKRTVDLAPEVMTV